MSELLTLVETSTLAQYLKTARWGYAAVNGLHILGIALLVGAILPLNLRLLGFWHSVDPKALAKVLVPVAATGLAIAITTGLCLISVRATEYAALTVVFIKLALVAIGTLAAISLHLSTRKAGAKSAQSFIDHASPTQLRAHAALSIVCWLGALSCGRLIAFVM